MNFLESGFIGASVAALFSFLLDFFPSRLELYNNLYNYIFRDNRDDSVEFRPVNFTGMRTLRTLSGLRDTLLGTLLILY